MELHSGRLWPYLQTAIIRQLEKQVRGICSSLLQKFVTYSHEKCYIIGPGLKNMFSLMATLSENKLECLHNSNLAN